MKTIGKSGLSDFIKRPTLEIWVILTSEMRRDASPSSNNRLWQRWRSNDHRSPWGPSAHRCVPTHATASIPTRRNQLIHPPGSKHVRKMCLWISCIMFLDKLGSRCDLWSQVFSCLFLMTPVTPYPKNTSSKRFCKVASSVRSCVISEASFFLSREISVKRSNSFRISSFRSSKGARFDCFHSFKQAPNSTMRLISPGKRGKLLRIYSSQNDSCKTISCNAMINALTWYP